MPQFKTNNWGLKLGFFSTVAGTGPTDFLAVSLLASETEESFTWVFHCFLDVFGTAPHVMFLDGDACMARALAAVMPATVLLRCIWHLANNLHTHVHGCFTGDEAGWRSFNSLWWRIAQETDINTRDTFDSEFDELLTKLDACRDTPAVRAAKAWLLGLKDIREKWAARWTWEHFTAGCSSNQRAEALNSSVKRYTTASMLLTNLVPKLEHHKVDISSRGETAQYILERRAERCAPSPIVDALAGKVTPFALTVLRAQLSEAGYYTSVADESSSGVFRVRRASAGAGGSAAPDVDPEVDALADFDFGRASTRERVTSLTACSCQFPTRWGLPCRHQLHLRIVLQRYDIPLSAISSLWQLLSGDVRTARLARLLALPRRAASGGAVAPPATRSERYAQLVAEFRLLAELASASASATAGLIGSLRQYLQAECTAIAERGALARRAPVPPAAAGAAGTGAPGSRSRAAAPRAHSRGETIIRISAAARGGCGRALGGRAPAAAGAPVVMGLPSAAARQDAAGGSLAAAPPAASQGKRRCKNCGMLGHYAKKCSQPPPALLLPAMAAPLALPAPAAPPALGAPAPPPSQTAAAAPAPPSPSQQLGAVPVQPAMLPPPAAAVAPPPVAAVPPPSAAHAAADSQQHVTVLNPLCVRNPGRQQTKRIRPGFEIVKRTTRAKH